MLMFAMLQYLALRNCFAVVILGHFTILSWQLGVVRSVITKILPSLHTLICFTSCHHNKLPPHQLCNFPVRRTLQSEEVWTTFTSVMIHKAVEMSLRLQDQLTNFLLVMLCCFKCWFNHTHQETLPQMNVQFLGLLICYNMVL